MSAALRADRGDAHSPAIRRDDRPLAGIALMVLGVSTLPLMDGIAKYLSADLHVIQIAWGRYLFHLLILLPLLAWRVPVRALLPRDPGLHAVRSAFLLGTTLCYFGAISFLPLADVLSLAFIGPLVCTALSPLVLREHVGPRRWAAVAIGFAGALIVIRPGLTVFHPASLLGLGAGLCYGAYLVTTRRLSGSNPPMVTLFHTAVIGAGALSVALPFVWVEPGLSGWAWMATMGALGALAHFLIIASFERAAAPVVASVSYIEIVAAAAVGWFAFGDFPDDWTWIGIGVIVASGVFVSVREGRLRRLPTAPAGPAGPQPEE